MTSAGAATLVSNRRTLLEPVEKINSIFETGKINVPLSDSESFVVARRRH